MGKNGEEVARIRGNVKKKTMQGRSANFEPMDVTITGKEEVAAMEKLLNRVANGSDSTCSKLTSNFIKDQARLRLLAKL